MFRVASGHPRQEFTDDRAVQAQADADADAEGCIDWSLVSVDSTVWRAHQHAAGARKHAPHVPGKRTRPTRHRNDEALDRSRGDFTCKIHLASEGGRRPLALKHTIPEPTNQRANRQRRGSAGGRPTSFGKEIYRHRNEAERTMNAIKGFRAVVTRDEKRAYVFHGSALMAAIRLWLRG